MDLVKNITGLAKYKANLLWVDDQSEILLFGKAFLGRRGYKVVIFENGFDALEELKSNNYDLLITDLNNSQINGIELLKKVKELKPQLITMIFSGSEKAEAIARELGCVAGLSKYGCKLEQLLATIEKALKTMQPKTFQNPKQQRLLTLLRKKHKLQSTIFR